MDTIGKKHKNAREAVMALAAMLVAGCAATSAPSSPVAEAPALPPPVLKAEPAEAPKSAPAPVAKAAASAPAPAAKAAPAPKPVAAAPAPAPAPAAAPALDLTSLEQRLKNSSAIGLMTKLSLKNQVDDLVKRFRAYHDGSRPPQLKELRPSYDMLMMKVLSLLQDKDASLAKDVNASREAIWGVLADRDKLSRYV